MTAEDWTHLDVESAIDKDMEATVTKNLEKARLQGLNLRAYKDALRFAYEVRATAAPEPERLTLWQAVLLVLRHLFVDPENGR